MSNPVAELLSSKNISYRISGKDFLIHCLNPDHDDRNPSLRVDQLTGITNCFACGFKTNIFKHFGILSATPSIKIAKLKEKLKNLTLESNGLEPVAGAKPYTNMFRNISVNTLRQFEAFYTTEEPDLEDRIVFPIKDVRGKTTAYVGRHTLSQGNPKYVVFPTNSTIELFPYKLEQKTENLVIVEGIFDFLNLYDKGMRNVTCTFGVSKLLNNTAQKLLPFKVVGITKIFILYDGDKAGRDSAETIKPLIEEAGFTVEIIRLPDDTDPGDLDAQSVQELIEYTK